MENNAIITMKSIQAIYDEKTETELVTKGNFRIENDTFYISYEDSEATGFEGSVTEIAVTGSRFASVIRKGSSSSDLIVEVNKKHHCHYETPYGGMDIGVYTHSIGNRLDKNGGELYLKYTLDINAGYMSDNEILINVRRI
ncbi:MAG: DUF1934 domain-containing protein [Porcipelethomonas sp.]